MGRRDDRKLIVGLDIGTSKVVAIVGELSADDKLEATVERNVLVQLDNLRTHPSVQAKESSGDLVLEGWVYRIDTGEVKVCTSGRSEFVPVESFSQPDRSSSTVA